jgi:hypothetical protein
MMPLLHEQEAINEQAKDPNMPIGPQLRPDQVARFTEINRETLTIRAKEIALSGYIRDARAIVKMAEIALGVRRGFTYAENSPDHFYHQYVMGLAGLADNQGGLDPTGAKDGDGDHGRCGAPRRSRTVLEVPGVTVLEGAKLASSSQDRPGSRICPHRRKRLAPSHSVCRATSS